MKELTKLLVCPSEEVEKRIIDMTAKEIDQLADQLHIIAKFFKSTQARAVLLKKIAKVDQGLTVIERKYKLGDYAPGIKKSIEGQDDISKEQKWPSVIDKLT